MSFSPENEGFLLQAVDLAQSNVDSSRGGPFGALVVRQGIVVAEGTNLVTTANDPTAHAEVVAIRNACAELEDFQLTDCTIYSSCEPCPMCLGAIYWARPDAVYFASTAEQAARAGFDDAFIYEEISTPKPDRRIPFIGLLLPEAEDVFENWRNKPSKVDY